MAGKRRGNGDGTYRKLPSGNWRVEISTPAGRRSHTARTKAECQDWARELRNQIERGTFVADRNLTCQKYFEEYLETVRRTLRPNTQQTQSSCMYKHIMPFFGSQRLFDLTPRQIQAFVRHLQDKGLAVSSVHSIYGVLKAALRSAVRLSLLSTDLTGKVKSPPAPELRNNSLTLAQVSELLNAMQDSPYYAIYVLGVTTGLRIGEILALHWEHVDLGAATLQVHHTVVSVQGVGTTLGPPKSKSSRRTVALPAATVQVLAQLPRKSELVFPSPYDPSRPLAKSSISGHWCQMRRRLGWPETITFHTLRHTCATLYLQTGVHPASVQHLLGHANIGMTLNRYTHVSMPVQRATAEAMDQMLACVNRAQFADTASTEATLSIPEPTSDGSV